MTLSFWPICQLVQLYELWKNANSQGVRSIAYPMTDELVAPRSSSATRMIVMRQAARKRRGGEVLPHPLFLTVRDHLRCLTVVVSRSGHDTQRSLGPYGNFLRLHRLGDLADKING